MRWHEAALERHQLELVALGRARQQLQQDLGGSSEQPAQQQEDAAAGAASMGADGSSDAATAAAADTGQLLQLAQENSGDAEVAVVGRAMMQLQRGTASELEEIEAKESDEAEWGAVLRAVHAGAPGVVSCWGTVGLHTSLALGWGCTLGWT